MLGRSNAARARERVDAQNWFNRRFWTSTVAALEANHSNGILVEGGPLCAI